MPPSGFFLDANLFVLLVVGSVGRDLIEKHRRLRAYSAEDYEILIDLLDRVERVFVTPNTLTETSNLLAQHREPERSRFFDRLRFIIHESEEVVVASAVASSNSAFNRLGLTDAALLEVVTPETPLVTVDLDLVPSGEREWAGSCFELHASSESVAISGGLRLHVCGIVEACLSSLAGPSSRGATEGGLRRETGIQRFPSCQ